MSKLIITFDELYSHLDKIQEDNAADFPDNFGPLRTKFIGFGGSLRTKDLEYLPGHIQLKIQQYLNTIGEISM